MAVLDKLTYAGNPANLEGIEHEFFHGDIADPEAVARAAAGCDAIVNFAAETHVDRSILGPQEFVHTDVLGTMCLLEWARANDARYVQVSTDEVYGDLEAGGRAVEDDPLRPSSPYSAAKAGGDLQVLAYCRTYGVRASITRGANTYGPNQYPEKLVPLFVTNALEGEPLPVYGDGKQVREWLHAEDHCAGIELVLHEGAPGEIYNVGGEDHENIEVTYRILELTGADPSLIRHVEDRAGHDRRYAIDDAKLRALGWSPRALVRRGRPARDGRLVSRQSRLVGADQVGLLSRLLRRAVRKPTQGLTRRTENSSVRSLMRHTIVPLLALVLATAATAATSPAPSDAGPRRADAAVGARLRALGRRLRPRCRPQPVRRARPGEGQPDLPRHPRVLLPGHDAREGGRSRPCGC